MIYHKSIFLVVEHEQKVISTIRSRTIVQYSPKDENINNDNDNNLKTFEDYYCIVENESCSCVDISCKYGVYSRRIQNI